MDTNNTPAATRTDRITRTKSGAKLHRSMPGFVSSLCGHRAPVEIAVWQLTPRCFPNLCGHCFGMGLQIGHAIGCFLRGAASVVAVAS